MYHQHAPQSDDGRMAWRYFLDNAWRVRVGGMSAVLGIDTGRAEQRLVAAGVDGETAEHLLDACEVGFVAANNERDEEGGEQE